MIIWLIISWLKYFSRYIKNNLPMIISFSTDPH